MNDRGERLRVLIVDDDASVLASLALLLKQHGLQADCVDEPAQALRLLSQQRYALVLQDMNFSRQTSGDEGMDLLQQIKRQQPHLPVLLMTAWGSIGLAVRGIKSGASDFFTKPWDNSHLVQLIRTTLDCVPDSEQTARRTLDAQFELQGVIGEHPQWLQILQTACKVARTRAPVLLLGESGTGKEMIAETIHRNSTRAARPFIKINMGAVSSSLFESEMFGHVRGAFTDAKMDRRGHFASAHEGSLFLDEVGEMPRADQVKLLRVLQDQRFQPVGSSQAQQVDVRIISATNRELAEQVASGEFREDLYYRLNLINLRLPPLRERRSDIALLAQAHLTQAAREYGRVVELSPSAREWLTAQHWPGNVRQLKQTLERSLLLSEQRELQASDLIAANALDEAPGSNGDLNGLTLEQAERQLLQSALQQHQGNITHIAKALGLSRAAVYRRLEKFGLQGDAGEES